MPDCCSAGVKDMLRFGPFLTVLVERVGFLIEIGFLGDERAQNR